MQFYANYFFLTGPMSLPATISFLFSQKFHSGDQLALMLRLLYVPGSHSSLKRKRAVGFWKFKFY